MQKHRFSALVRNFKKVEHAVRNQAQSRRTLHCLLLPLTPLRRHPGKRPGLDARRSGQGEQAQGAWDRKRTSRAGAGRAWVWGPVTGVADISKGLLVPAHRLGLAFLEADGLRLNPRLHPATHGSYRGGCGAELGRWWSQALSQRGSGSGWSPASAPDGNLHCMPPPFHFRSPFTAGPNCNFPRSRSRLGTGSMLPTPRMIPTQHD